MDTNSVANPQSEVNTNPLLIRAQYDARSAAAQGPKSSAYRFDTPLDTDANGNYCHRLIITRLADNAEITNTPYYNTDDLNDAISAWMVQLNISSIDTAMWGHS